MGRLLQGLSDRRLVAIGVCVVVGIWFITHGNVSRCKSAHSYAVSLEFMVFGAGLHDVIVMHGIWCAGRPLVA